MCGDDLSHVDDEALVGAITGWTRAVATAECHRLAAIAELTERRGASELAIERQFWACDGWDSAAAEVSAASGISARAASGQMHQGVALRHRLPQIAKLMADGMLSARLASTVTWRTQLVEDPEIMARVDADLAGIAASWGPMSVAKSENAIDAVITVHDPAAVRRFQAAASGCDVSFGHRDDATGTASMWGRLTAVDAELVQRSVEQVARGVCPHDPRTLGERRSQALGVLAAGGTQLRCTCGRADCSAAVPDARANAIVIHVLSDHPQPQPDSGPDGPDNGPDDPDNGPGPDPVAGDPSLPPSRGNGPGLAVIAGGAVVPTALLAELVALGASVRPVAPACELGGEPRYRPPARLQRFVRSRDLTCCFPACDRPAERCDVDHTIPHGAGGPTHPGNTKCLCRKHHLLKTFWNGRTGWTDRQFTDGTIVWTSPTGHRYTRPPGSRLLFPRWDTTTPLPPGAAMTAPPATGSINRAPTMPTRTYTRTQDRTQRLRAERQRNQRAIDDDAPLF